MYMTTRPVTSGGEAPPKIFFVPLEKCVGHSLKNLGPSENSSPHLVSQAGYGTDDNQMPLQTNCAQFRAVGTLPIQGLFLTTCQDWKHPVTLLLQ